MDRLRILLLADSHLGFDLPLRPRVARRRRGHDFLANHAAALALATAGEVDLVVHGGDVFDRPDVPPSLAHQAYAPLLAVAARGVPVFVVPGNHERGRLPHARLARHPRLHVFDRPRTFRVEVRGRTIALAGFPYERRDVRTRFPELLQQTAHADEPAAVKLLCIHHCVEGATVGPGDFTFRTAADVIRIRDVPSSFGAVFSGHIHRHQVLERDLRGDAVAVPVMYPGSIERTSSAEAEETKGCMMVDVPFGGAARATWRFHELYARPMLSREIDRAALRGASVEDAVRRIVDAAPADAVLTIRVSGAAAHVTDTLTAARLRAFVPPTMNLDLRFADSAGRVRHAARSRRAHGAPRGIAAGADRAAAAVNLELGL